MLEAGRSTAPEELTDLERLIDMGARCVRARVECRVAMRGESFPVYVLEMGSTDPLAPAIGFFGGVHGLERIGTQVLLAFLRSLVARVRWDPVLQRQMELVRLVFMPLVNPAGMQQGTRSNARGVDLMRNAPVEAENARFLVGGQRLSHRLPWYRGRAGDVMEIESRALCRVVEEELLARPFSLALDCHSGFGLRDRIWFPYAHTRAPIEHLPEIHALKALFDESYPHHDYLVEPQSRHYMAHGDLWDHLYRQAGSAEGRIFLPLTLEMGSWRWVKKSPRQLFSRAGMFNPIAPHRHYRILRRHLVWLDFLTRSVSAFTRWVPSGHEREEHRQRALRLWYGARER